MKHYFRIFLIIIFGLILQILFYTYLHIFNAGPQILLITLIYFALLYGTVFGETYGFICGLFVDIFSVSLFGTHAFVFTLLGYIYGKLSHKLDESQVIVQLLSILAASYFYILIMFLINIITGTKKEITITMVTLVPLYNIIISPFLFKILSKISPDTSN